MVCVCDLGPYLVLTLSRFRLLPYRRCCYLLRSGASARAAPEEVLGSRGLTPLRWLVLTERGACAMPPAMLDTEYPQRDWAFTGRHQLILIDDSVLFAADQHFASQHDQSAARPVGQ